MLTSVPLIRTTVGDEHDNYVKFQMISNNYGAGNGLATTSPVQHVRHTQSVMAHSRLLMKHHPRKLLLNN